MKILVINGPNINRLGMREPSVYGNDSYVDLLDYIQNVAAEEGVSVECVQSNHEGDLVDWIQQTPGVYDGIVINPAAYTHTSVAILDAVKAVGIPTVEVHISDMSSREAFRQNCYIGQACIKIISGRGFDGYIDA
ncbi:MAG: type II 3-dehydroquinate dehydratase, partial [Lachnospiraceae bacterium]|nr:type II 3-dehydroquinate dehydratase [Lachnospiraceae bacterium]